MYKGVDNELLERMQKASELHDADDTPEYFEALYECIRQYNIETGDVFDIHDTVFIFADWIATHHGEEDAQQKLTA